MMPALRFFLPALLLPAFAHAQSFNLNQLLSQGVNEAVRALTAPPNPAVQSPPPVVRQPPAAVPAPRPASKKSHKPVSQPAPGAAARQSPPKKTAGPAAPGAAVAGGAAAGTVAGPAAGAPVIELRQVAAPPLISPLLVPMFNGVPYRGGVGSAGVKGGEFHLMRWFTAMQLAAQPELLDDHDIALHVARLFLPAEKWGDYLVCATCITPSSVRPAGDFPAAQWKGTDEFSRPRSRDAFIRDYRHAFDGLGAHYPVALYTAFSGTFGSYSPAAGGFPIQWRDLSNDKSNTLSVMPLAGKYAAPMAATLPAVLPCQPERCERIIAQTKARTIYGLTKLSITKLEVDALGADGKRRQRPYLSQASMDGAFSIYSDANFSALLHTFDRATTVLAAQGMDDNAVAAGFRQGPAVFNPDTMALLRAKHDPAWRARPDFNESLGTVYRYRQELEGYFYGIARTADGRWPAADRWGPYFQMYQAMARGSAVDRNDVAKFSRWNDARIQALPQSLLIRHELDGDAARKPFIGLANGNLEFGHSNVDNMHRQQAQDKLAKALSAQGIASEANILSVRFYNPYDLRAAVLIFPQPLSDYVVQGKKDAGAPSGGGVLISEIEADVDTVKFWPENAPSTMLVYVTPRKARVLKGTAVIAQGALGAGQAPAAPFGLDILGIKLGMPFAEAEAQVRAQINPDSVEQWKAQQPGLGYSQGKIFSSYQQNDFVELYATADDRVAAVIRRLLLGRDVDVKAVVKQIVGKYGEPQKKVEDHYRYEWRQHEMASLCYARGSQRIDVVTTEGPSKGSGKISNADIALFPADGPYVKAKAFEQCGPLLAMRASYGGSGALLRFEMYDHRAYVQTASGLKQPPESTPAQAPAAPKFKF